MPSVTPGHSEGPVEAATPYLTTRARAGRGPQWVVLNAVYLVRTAIACVITVEQDGRAMLPGVRLVGIDRRWLATSDASDALHNPSGLTGTTDLAPRVACTVPERDAFAGPSSEPRFRRRRRFNPAGLGPGAWVWTWHRMPGGHWPPSPLTAASSCTRRGYPPPAIEERSNRSSIQHTDLGCG